MIVIHEHVPLNPMDFGDTEKEEICEACYREALRFLWEASSASPEGPPEWVCKYDDGEIGTMCCSEFDDWYDANVKPCTCFCFEDHQLCANHLIMLAQEFSKRTQ